MTLKCKKTGRDMDMGYIGFDRLRTKVADLMGSDVGVHYRELNKIDNLPIEERRKAIPEYNKKMQQLIESKALDEKVAEFLYQADDEGKVNHKVCKRILKVIGNYDDDIIYGYGGRENPGKFKDFKAILQDCVKNKCPMVWL